MNLNFHEVKDMPEVLILSSSLLTDRMFLYSRFFERLNEECAVKVWAMSACTPRSQQVWRDSPVCVEEFPAIRSFKEIPHNYLRRLNEFVWDYRQQSPSRLSMMRHVRNTKLSTHIKALKLPGRALALIHVERLFEDSLEKLLLAYPRSQSARERLR